jgi:hypothetical protein
MSMTDAFAGAADVGTTIHAARWAATRRIDTRDNGINLP